MALPGLSADPVEVAPRLLGARLHHAGVTVRLTEVEAYGGADDPGSHAHRGRTPRNASMFGPAGRLYVYLSHGVHHCANVVCGAGPGAVLLRAGEVVDGVERARERRPGVPDRNLARGPGCLARTLALDLSHDGLDLAGHLVDGDQPAGVDCGPRVGLRLAPDRPWRFWVPGDPTVSRYVRSPRAHA